MARDVGLDLPYGPQGYVVQGGGAQPGPHGPSRNSDPPLGALPLDILPIKSILAIDVGITALAIALLRFIRIPHPENGDAGKASEGSIGFLGTCGRDFVS